MRRVEVETLEDVFGKSVDISVCDVPEVCDE
jgi:hypothetical protein